MSPSSARHLHFSRGVSVNSIEGIFPSVCTHLNYSGDVVHVIIVLCQKANIFNQLLHRCHKLTANDPNDPNDIFAIVTA